ncbi:hypothetical protein Tco_1555219 [Tanacetum coccineum]
MLIWLLLYCEIELLLDDYGGLWWLELVTVDQSLLDGGENILTLGEKPVGVRDSERSPNAESPYKSRDFVQPTPNFDVSGPDVMLVVNNMSNKSLPNLNNLICQDMDDDQEDMELDDLLCSFQRLFEGTDIGMHSKGDMKKKLKHRKKKLVVGGSSSPMGLVSQRDKNMPIDDDGALQFIGEQVGRFTRFDKDDRKASKLDRFLASYSFFDMWKDASVSVLSRSHLDHCPIMLKVGCSNYGPKPFKVFNKWIGGDNFNELVSNSWAGFQSNLRPDLCLTNKLKRLRLVVKEWTFNRIAAQNNAKESLKHNLIEWDKKAKNGLSMTMVTDEMLTKEVDDVLGIMNKMGADVFIMKRIRVRLCIEILGIVANLYPSNFHVDWGFKDSQRGLYYVKWKTVLLDPKFGDLGVGFLHAKNLGLLGKWKWRFLIEEKALWNIVIKEFYGAEGALIRL